MPSEPTWCEQARSLYEEGQNTFKIASLLQRPASSVWKALHPELAHEWTVAERAERAVLDPNRRSR
jgi:hypothetical protein